MATTKTRQQLVNRALAILLKLPASQSANAEDYATVDGYVDGLFEQLRIRNVAYVADDSQIPVEWIEPLAVLLANNAAYEFGLPGAEITPANPNPVLSAESKLRELNYAQPTYEPLESEYF